MSRNNFIKIILLLILNQTLQANNNVGLDINKKDIEILASTKLDLLDDYAYGTFYTLNFYYIHTKEEDDEKDDGNLVNISFLVQNPILDFDAVSLAVGISAVATDDFVAMPFIVRANYDVPLIENIMSSTFSLQYAYAPQRLSFSNAESYSEFRTELDIEILAHTHLFVGYRYIDTVYIDVDRTFNNSAYAGMKLSF